MSHPPKKIKVEPPKLKGQSIYKKLKQTGDTNIDLEREALVRSFRSLKEK